ncbi:MAG: TonB family protein [Bacteroidota bacterium]
MKYILFCLFIIFASALNAQNDTLTTYYSNYWKPIKKSEARFYRKSIKVDSLYFAIDFKINKQILKKGFYTSDSYEVKEGPFSYYYENGQKMSEGNYSKNKQIGVWEKWYSNGNKQFEGEYIDLLKNGNWTYWDNDGKILATISYVNDKKNGKWNSWYANGKKEQEGIYNENNKEGLWTTWYKNGSIDSIGKYSNGKRDSLWAWYFENKTKESEGLYVNGEKQGLWKTWFENGAIDSEIKYVLGKKDGLSTSYFENKTKESEGLFVNGEKQGLWKTWFESGAIDSEVKYINGKKDSVCSWFYENGIASAKGNFKNDAPETISLYNEDSTVSNVEFKEEVKPSYKGGDEAMFRFLAENIRYPEEAKENGISGKVFVSFTIDKDGSIADITIVKSPHPSLSKEAIRVIKLMPKWIPGEVYNRKIKTTFTLPVAFQLQ